MAESSQAFTITSCTHADLDSCFAIISAAFQHRAPFVDVLFPNHDTPQGAEQGVIRLKSWQDSDPNAHFIRAASSNGDTVGFAVWTFMHEPPPADLAKVEDMEAVWGKLPNGEAEKEFARQLWRWYVIPRSDAVKASGEKGVYVLELLAVHPKVHRQGAGEALTRWGTRKADEKSVKAVVESVPNAVKLYEKCGFKTTIKHMKFELDAKFADRRKPELIFLERTVGDDGRI